MCGGLLSDPHAAIEWLVAQQARLPRQTRRDEVYVQRKRSVRPPWRTLKTQGFRVEFQQFSTPPVQALVLVKAAALRRGMKVLEPTVAPVFNR